MLMHRVLGCRGSQIINVCIISPGIDLSVGYHARQQIFRPENRCGALRIVNLIDLSLLALRGDYPLCPRLIRVAKKPMNKDDSTGMYSVTGSLTEEL